MCTVESAGRASLLTRSLTHSASRQPPVAYCTLNEIGNGNGVLSNWIAQTRTKTTAHKLNVCDANSSAAAAAATATAAIDAHKLPQNAMPVAILLLRLLSMMRAEQRERECVGWRESRKTCPLWLTINKSTATLTAQRSLFCMSAYVCVCVCALAVPLPSSKLFKTINIHLTQHVQLAAPTLHLPLSLSLLFLFAHVP